jgi:hypothetical protein
VQFYLGRELNFVDVRGVARGMVIAGESGREAVAERGQIRRPNFVISASSP